MMRNKQYMLYVFIPFFVLVAGCATQEKTETLADLDVSNTEQMQSSVFIKPKSEEEIKQAYYNYINNASKEDKSRLNAINRLAKLELELSEKLLKDSQSEQQELIEDTIFVDTLNKTIELLTTSIRDYPGAKDNHNSLYQLARSYDQLGQYDKAIDAMQQLVKKHPESPYYAEAQFRLAENAFVQGDYITAEDAYTEVIVTPTSDRFYEKSLFKRGWTRYKQQLYREAIDDYLEALTLHNFGEIKTMDSSEKNQFDEYFRAIGLAFSYISNADTLRQYFADKQDFKYLYHTYSVIADIYLKQQRYSDAAQTLEQFSQSYPNSNKVAHAQLKAIETWEAGGFKSKFYQAIAQFYNDYSPSAAFWSKQPNLEVQKEISQALRQYIVLVSSNAHSQYQTSKKARYFNESKRWYDRYLEHYQAYANKDNIYNLYAELLSSAGRQREALGFFELAAYDGDLILNKKSAYATITISDQLYKKAQSAKEQALLREKHIHYAELFVQLYPSDARSGDIAVHAAQLNFAQKKYQDAIALAHLVQDNANDGIRYRANNLKARSYFELEQYPDAEQVYLEMLSSGSLKKRERKNVENSLAVSIYRQGESATKSQKIQEAQYHLSRISDIAPNSEVAATGLYDAITLSVSKEHWDDAIDSISKFQKLYPKHKYAKDVTRKLSVAYLNSDQKTKAARTFQTLSSFEQDNEIKMAALWQAAELYRSQDNKTEAIRAYREYAHSFPQPFPQNIEAMYQLGILYKDTGDRNKQQFWQRKIQSTETRARKSVKTERTNYIASQSIIELARSRKVEFNQIRLRQPLARNLQRKKKAMQESVKLFGQSSAYGLEEVTTEATNAIGNIYQEFSVALLKSERPKNLKAEELEQYEILLEDQAFPFEEKAIEFYETNLSRVKDGTYDKWIENSFSHLLTLFPVRYGREGKINIIHKY